MWYYVKLDSAVEWSYYFITIVHRVNLDLIKVKDVMAKPVYTLHITESLSRLANILITTEHEGFPVIKYSEESKQEVAYGFVTR